MIDRVVRTSWRIRQLASRSEVAARLLGTTLPPSTERGLVIVQIDGLAKGTLARAVKGGAMPVVARLLADGDYDLHGVYSGLPSSTAAAQGELFYGVPMAVPAWAFVDRTSGLPMQMSHPDDAAQVEQGLAGNRPLLAAGSSYCNLFRGGAAEARFCISSLTWTDPIRTRHPLALPFVVLAFGTEILRTVAVLVTESVRAPFRLAAAVTGGQDLRSELKFAASHMAVGVGLRELTVLSAMIDAARGTPAVYVNFLGYDEVAHRRGPSSSTGTRELRALDAEIGRLVVAARQSRRRSYEVWVLSDHGQERTVSYVERHGRLISDAVADVFRSQAIEVDVATGPRPGSPLERPILTGHIGAIGRRDGRVERWRPGRLVVAAQGPLGHIYAPRRLVADERDAIAAALVRQADVPMVLCPDGPGAARVWVADATWRLPADAAHVLGAEHPYLQSVAEDLVALCHHAHAGDFLICGWTADGPAVSFPHENGSHGGPGPAETDAFVLAPWDVSFGSSEGGRGRPLRLRDVRRAAFSVLDGARDAPAGLSRPAPAQQPVEAGAVRVLTYNVHSCVGLDGAVSVERIAQVIASHDPDIVALQELDVRRSRTGSIDQAQAIADRLEMLLHFHPALAVGEELYGDAILTRLPMRIVRAGALPRWRRLEPRGAIHAAIDVGGATLEVVNTHLSLDPVEGAMQAAALAGREWLGSIPSGRAVLCGDLNALTWFPAHRRLTRRLKNAQTSENGRRLLGTFHGAALPGPIDHVLVDPTIDVTGVAAGDDGLARVASDHLPLIVDLRLGAST